MNRYSLGFLLALPAIVLGSDWFDGENLLVEPPDAELYDTYTKNEPGWQSTLWQSKAQGGDDTYVVNVVSGKPGSLSKFRKIQDKSGIEACSEFESEVIDDSKRNGYKSVLWHTTCKFQGTVISSIQLAIGGRDSLYHVRKLWKIPVSDSEFQEWKGVISQISVCDTRNDKKSCPEGYEKQQNI